VISTARCPHYIDKELALQNAQSEATMAAMPTRNPVSTANLMGHPLHPILVTLPIGFFVATFLFDLVFWQTGTE
jgi:hypothetical protein